MIKTTPGRAVAGTGSTAPTPPPEPPAPHQREKAVEITVQVDQAAAEAEVLKSALEAKQAAPDHGARKHSKVSPSKLNYLDAAIGGCPGFKGSDETNDAAEEGTRLHEILDVALGEAVRKGWFQSKDKTGRAATFAGWLWTRRIATGWDDTTMALLDFCAKSVDPFLAGKGPHEVQLEQRLDILDEVGSKLMWGHTDLFIRTSPTSGILIDWKFGWLPVPESAANRQGLAYAIGVFDAVPSLQTIGLMFVQPKLGTISKGVLYRSRLVEYKRIVADITRESNEVSAQFEGQGELEVGRLNPGDTCRYCVRAADCPAFRAKVKTAVQRVKEIPIPDTLDVMAIQTPEQAAVAALWCDFLLDKLPDLKKRCLDVAKANGGAVHFVGQDGMVVAYKETSRSLPRKLGAATEIAKACEQWAAPEDILAAADLKIGALENVIIPMMIADAGSRGETLTKTAAKGQLSNHLEVHGLLSRQDGTVESLTRDKIAERNLVGSLERRADGLKPLVAEPNP